MKNILRSGVLILTLLSLISCSGKTDLLVIEEKPEVYPSEVRLLPYPEKPPVEERTNCSMHNFRLKVEEWGCDAVMVLGGPIHRLSGTNVIVPNACIDIIKGERTYMDCGQ